MEYINIFVLDSIYPGVDFTVPEFERLRNIAPNLKFHIVPKTNLTDEMAALADIFYGCVPVAFLPRCKKLKWLHLASAGAAEYCDPALYQNPDCLLTNSSGVFGIPIAEHVMALLLGLTRRVDEFVRQGQQPLWKNCQPLRDICGSTVGILGYGDIGSQVAGRLQGFMCKKIVGVRRHPGACPPELDALYGMDALDEVIASSDILIICLPGTKDTYHLLDAKRLGSMKEGSFLINIGRGSIVDQEALIDALQNGPLAGAGLDVVTPEPLPADSPLWKMQNVIISSHSSGGSPHNPVRSFAIFERNLKHYLAGEPMENQVDFNLQY